MAAGMNSVSNDISPTAEAVDMEPSQQATFFHTEYKKHGDLREMLDSNKDSLKLDAMKRIVAMMAKGRDVSDLFPAVVKNVASKNIEVKKLVYVYLTRYAEEQQDLALLSISTFQRALKDPNQLIRASALRVLSSIRVPVIVPIMLPAIKESSVDMSPFVRKTAAHAIPKLYSLDPEMKEELLSVIEKLLADRTTLVVGSAAMAFEEVCPERLDLIHKHYRKLLNLLVDVEEWGQVTLLNMLTRYARTQFQDPNLGDLGEEEEKDFYDESDDENTEKIVIEQDKIKPLYKMDPDHRLLLRSTKPLLQSRNASVVMSTAQLYWHLAPKPEISVVAKALVRLLRSHFEIQSIVLNCIASMTIKESGARMFGPFLRQFFVRGSDPAHVKILKLEILTNLAREDNISMLLREFQSYVASGDKSCATATIQAIGRCAATIADVTATCLNGLVHLLSSADQAVVAESVLEIKKLLQTQEEEHKDIISQMARLVDTIEIGSAKAAILWVVGEYCERIPLIAPDVLRKMAKTFCNEVDEVKLQVLNLAVKLCLTNPRQTKLLTQYVLNLAKYDLNYDIRDRARFMRAILFPSEPNKITKSAKKIFLVAKPPPVIASKFKNRDEYQLGSLSHYINAKANGYQDLPEFPEVPPDQSVRNVEPPKPADNPWLSSSSSGGRYGDSSPRYDGGSGIGSGSRVGNLGRGLVDGSGGNGAGTGFYDDVDFKNGNDGSSGSSSSETSDSESSSESSDSDGSESDAAKKSAGRSAKAAPHGAKAANSGSAQEKQQTLLSSSGKSKGVNNGTKAEGAKKSKPASGQLMLKRAGAGDSSSSSSDSSDSDSSDDEVTTTRKKTVNQKKKASASSSSAAPSKPVSNLDLLLDLGTDSLGGVGLQPTPASVSATVLTPNAASPTQGDSMTEAKPMWVSETPVELINKLVTGGVQVDYRFTRSPHIYAPDMLSVELTFGNQTSEDTGEVKVGAKHLASGMSIHEFPGLPNIPAGQSRTVTLGIDFRDTTQAAKFDLVIDTRPYSVSISPPMGELVRPLRMTEAQFTSEMKRLRGMNEMQGQATLPTHACDASSITKKIYKTANLLQVPGGEVGTDLWFAGRTLSAKQPVTISLNLNSGSVTVKTDNIVVGSLLLKQIVAALQQ